MIEVLDSGHVITDEDVDTARLIMDLDRALGRPTDSLTKRVAGTPAEQVRTLLSVPGARAPRINGHEVPAAADLVRTITSQENAAELAREVAEQLPTDLDPAEEQRLVSKLQDVIHRRMVKLVAGVDSGH